MREIMIHVVQNINYREIIMLLRNISAKPFTVGDKVKANINGVNGHIYDVTIISVGANCQPIVVLNNNGNQYSSYSDSITITDVM